MPDPTMNWDKFFSDDYGQQQVQPQQQPEPPAAQPDQAMDWEKFFAQPPPPPKRSLSSAIPEMIAGFGGVVADPIFAGGVNPVKQFMPGPYERAKTITGLTGAVGIGAAQLTAAGAAATASLGLGGMSVAAPAGMAGGGAAAAIQSLAMPAMFTATSAGAPFLEKYFNKEAQPESFMEGVKTAAGGIGQNLRGLWTGEEAPSVARAFTIGAPDKLLGIKLDTPEKKAAYGQMIESALYAVVMPGTIKGAIQQGNIFKARKSAGFGLHQQAIKHSLPGKTKVRWGQTKTAPGVSARNNLTYKEAKIILKHLNGEKFQGEAKSFIEARMKDPNVLKSAIKTSVEPNLPTGKQKSTATMSIPGKTPGSKRLTLDFGEYKSVKEIFNSKKITPTEIQKHPVSEVGRKRAAGEHTANIRKRTQVRTDKNFLRTIASLPHSLQQKVYEQMEESITPNFDNMPISVADALTAGEPLSKFYNNVYPTQNPKIWNYLGNEVNATVLATYVKNNPDIFPNGASDLKFMKLKDLQGTPVAVKDEHREEMLKQVYTAMPHVNANIFVTNADVKAFEAFDKGKATPEETVTPQVPVAPAPDVAERLKTVIDAQEAEQKKKATEVIEKMKQVASVSKKDEADVKRQVKAAFKAPAVTPAKAVQPAPSDTEQRSREHWEKYGTGLVSESKQWAKSKKQTVTVPDKDTIVESKLDKEGNLKLFFSAPSKLFKRDDKLSSSDIAILESGWTRAELADPTNTALAGFSDMAGLGHAPTAEPEKHGLYFPKKNKAGEIVRDKDGDIVWVYETEGKGMFRYSKYATTKEDTFKKLKKFMSTGLYETDAPAGTGERSRKATIDPAIFSRHPTLMRTVEEFLVKNKIEYTDPADAIKSLPAELRRQMSDILYTEVFQTNVSAREMASGEYSADESLMSPALEKKVKKVLGRVPKAKRTPTLVAAVEDRLMRELRESADRDDFVKQHVKDIMENKDLSLDKKKELLQYLADNQYGIFREEPAGMDKLLEVDVDKAAGKVLPTRRVSIKDMSDLHRKTGMNVHVWWGGKVWVYYEAELDGVIQRFFVDGPKSHPILNPGEEVSFDIKGAMNEPSTAMSGHVGPEMWANPMTQEEIDGVSTTKNDIILDNALAKTVPGAYKFTWDWSKFLENTKDFWSKEKFKKEIVAGERTEKAAKIRNMGAARTGNATHRHRTVHAHFQLVKEAQHDEIISLMHWTVSDPYWKNDGSWAWSNRAPAGSRERKEGERILASLPTEYFNYMMEWRARVDMEELKYRQAHNMDLSMYQQQRFDGYWYRQVKTKDGIDVHWSPAGISGGDAEKASFHKKRTLDTWEEFKKEVAEKYPNVQVVYDVGKLMGQREAEGWKRNQLDSLVKEWSGIDYDEKHKLVEYGSVGPVDAEPGEWLDVGKNVRWLNKILPSGQTVSAWMPKDYAMVLKDLFEATSMPDWERRWRRFQQMVRGLVLVNAAAVGQDNLAGPMAVIGPFKSAKIVGQNVMAAIKGDAGIAFTNPEHWARAMRAGMPIGSEMMAKTFQLKFEESANSWFDEIKHKGVKDWKWVSDQIFYSHGGTTQVLWNTVSNLMVASFIEMSGQIMKKHGVSEQEADKLAGAIISDFSGMPPDYTWSKSVGKLLSMTLLARAFATAVPRVLTGAFPPLERALPWKPLRHNISDAKKRAIAAEYYQKILFNQVLGYMLAANIFNMMFNGGRLIFENEEGHKMDIKLPMRDKRGRDIYINVPIYRQLDNVFRLMSNVSPPVGRQMYGTGQGPANMLKAKLDPLLKETINQIYNIDSFTAEEIWKDGATVVEGATGRLTHAVSNLSPFKVGEWYRQRQAIDAALWIIGSSASRGFPGGAGAKQDFSMWQRGRFEKDAGRKKLKQLTPGTAAYYEQLMKMSTGMQGYKNEYLKVNNPELYWRIKAMRQK